MPVSLLPASAAAFAPRSAPTIVLNKHVEPWLTQTLKRTSRIKRPLNNVSQHFRCLTDTLSAERATWTLCSLILPHAPHSELTKHSDPLAEALFNYRFLHVEAYVVHVDMVSRHEVAFKLTQDTIDALAKYHKDIYSVDVSASTWPWPEKEIQLMKLQEEFVHAVNRYVFRTGVRALEGLEEDGAGELLDARSDLVKSAINALFLPLLPPPPRIVDVVRRQFLLPSSTHGGDFWHPASYVQFPHPQSVDSWKVLPSTPGPSLPSCSAESQPSFWSSMGPNDVQLPSPTPSYTQTAFSASSHDYGHMLAESPPLSLPVTSAGLIAQQ